MPRCVQRTSIEQGSFGIWEFPKIRGTLFWGPYNKDPTIEAPISGSPIFGNSHIADGRRQATRTEACWETSLQLSSSVGNL